MSSEFRKHNAPLFAGRKPPDRRLLKEIPVIFVLVMVCASLLASCVLSTPTSEPTQPAPAVTTAVMDPAATLTALFSAPQIFSPFPTSTTTPVPTQTATPYPLPSEEQVTQRFNTEIAPLVTKLEAASPNDSITINPAHQVVFVPKTARQFYVQSILQPQDSPGIESGMAAYILYDVSRGKSLGYQSRYDWRIPAETQEITVNLSLVVEQDGNYYLVESASATGTEGNTTLEELVRASIPAISKLDSLETDARSDLEVLVGYGCGIDIDPNLDYQRRLALFQYAMTSDDWAARRQGIDGLAVLDPLPLQVAPDLVPLLGDEDFKYRVDDLLAEMAGDPQVLQLLIDSIGDPNPGIRAGLARIMRFNNAPTGTTTPALLTLFYDQDFMVREEAMTSLSVSEDPSIIVEMITALKDEDPSIRESAANVLQNIGINEPSVEAIPDLVALLKDPSADVRAAAAYTLGSYGALAISALPDLAAAAQVETEHFPFEGMISGINSVAGKQDSLPILINAARSSVYYIRLAASRLLEEYQGMPGVVDALLPLLNDPDMFIRSGAIASLEGISDPRAVEPLVGVLADVEYRVAADAENALVSFGAAAVQPLVNALGSPDGLVRERAARALMNIQDDRANGPLLAALERSDLSVIKGAYQFFIQKGRPGSEALLIQALNASGTQGMAEDFLNCGNQQLQSEAEKWAQANGYTITTGSNWTGPVWGSRP